MDTKIRDNFSSVGSSFLTSDRTFKSGESHSIGVVFEDTPGRTTGVYELGSVDVLRKSDRANKGAASIDVSFNASGLDSELTNYFYVYSGGNGIEDYVQYSVPSALVIDSTKVTDNVGRDVYVSLRALQGADNSYNETKDPSYSYTEGDKVRVISYVQDDIRIYPSGLEFEVKGVETIDADSFVLNGATYDSKIHNGQFCTNNDEFATDFDYNSVFAGTADGIKMWLLRYTPLQKNQRLRYTTLSQVNTALAQILVAPKLLQRVTLGTRREH